MRREVLIFLIALALGIATASLAFWFWGSRYEVVAIGGMDAIKVDRWTGQTWMRRYYEKPTGTTVFYWESLSERPKPRTAREALGLEPPQK